MEMVAILAALGTLVTVVVVVAVYHRLLSPDAIEEDEEHNVEEESAEERAHVLLERQRKIEEAKLEEKEDGYSGQ